VLIPLLALSHFLAAQESIVRGQVTVIHSHRDREPGSSNVVVWLAPLGRNVAVAPLSSARLLQRNKEFTPHVTAVTEGTSIEFPNRDPFFHDVFSIYHGKPFDLGLYESGAVRKIVFSRPGISYIFCNIHPEMSAIVVVTRTPYFAVTGTDGKFKIKGVPPGHYRLEVWYEFASETELGSLSHELEVLPDQSSLGLINVHSSDMVKEHLNKYEEPYTPVKASY
jgi:hypothetical protein